MLELDLKAQIQNLIAVQNFNDARNLSARLCEQSPDDAEAYFLHGTICGQLGDFSASEEALLAAYAQVPNHPQLNYNLAVSLYEQDKLDQAIEYATRFVQLEPTNFQGWLYLGQICELAEKTEYTEKSYIEAIKLQPMSDEAIRKLGAFYMSQQQWLLAAEVYNKLIEMGHTDEDVIKGIGDTLARAYQYDKLISILEPLVTTRPDDVTLHYRIATAYMDLGDLVTAEKFFNNALTADSNHAESVAGLAGVYKFQGDYDKANKILSPFIQSHPDNPGVLLVFAAIAHKCNRIDEATLLLQNLLDNTTLTNATEAKILVSLGTLCELQEDYVKGFQFFQKGNKIYSPDFDREAHIKNIELLEQLYAFGKISSLPVSGSESKTPIFIIGMPRSGTSLVEQILSSHTEVYGAGELKYIQDLAFQLSAQQINDKPYPDCVTDVPQSDLLNLSKNYIDTLASLSGNSEKVTDKMPTNFIYLGLIYQLFPNAKILHCVRNPMDTCLSCYSKFFSGAYTYTYDLDDLGFYYRSYERLMKFWKDNLPLNIYDVNYEELVNDQESGIKNILDYCDLPWDQNCMTFYDTDRTVATASTDQVRQPMYKSSIDKWRRYGDNVQPLSDALEKYK
ncbi:hypothetical protein MNBD_GAMMA05-605 [hydrothermal vent metagenome]|uniref:Uncharacterized protein n=1 Tax=hydrothermal vent metagenome TaxID=652676 RepID=A0A3B0WHV1_9ZZZZ